MKSVFFPVCIVAIPHGFPDRTCDAGNYFSIKKAMYWLIMKKFTVKKRHTIRKGKAAEVFSRLTEQIGEGAALFAADAIEILETSNDELRFYLINKKPLIMEYGNWIFPTLKGAIERPFPQRRVSVDAGAIPYVVNGADVMRPGIVNVTPDVRANCPVQVVDDRHKKPLAIALALFDAPQIRDSTAGKMCKNVHFVGDEIWNLEF
ncbi:MAG: PUA domain protein [Methanoregula sp. PtaU1.Bin051]|nr:MAG: PUA domain protein [Methanoregula sp. PtaU1.Bin051]